jgi:hypothetical protein
MGDKAECNVALRFNFLSTDFSISKGVEGTICRLCVKTEVLSSGSAHWLSEIPEMCFCELKLFRHHGSDRKLKNDFVHMRKVMDQLNQQIAVAEIEFGNRKQTTSWIRTKATSEKVSKRKGASCTSSSRRRNDTKEDLCIKLQRLQDNLARKQPISVFCLRGQSRDDPDLHPVSPTHKALSLTKVESNESTAWQQRTGHWNSSVDEICSLPSPSPRLSSSQLQGNVPTKFNFSAAAAPTAFNGCNESQLVVSPITLLQQSNSPYLAGSLDQPTRVQRLQQDTARTLTNWIEVIDIDPSYTPPPEKPAKPGLFLSTHD